MDHEIWTLKGSVCAGFLTIPFLYKEVWLNDNKPGEIHFIFAWERRMESWREIDQKELPGTQLDQGVHLGGSDAPYELIRVVQNGGELRRAPLQPLCRESDWEEKRNEICR